MRRALRGLTRVGDGFLSVTPRIVITDTYQVMFAFALVGMGVVSLISFFLPSAGSGAISHALPDGLRLLWAIGLAIGGVSQILGVQWSSREVERAGLALSALGCGVYSAALGGYSHTFAGYILCGVFGLIAGAYCLRLYVSSKAKRIARKVVLGT